MSDYDVRIKPGQDMEYYRALVHERANDKEVELNQLKGAANILYKAPKLTKEKIEFFFERDSTALTLLLDKLAANDLTETFYKILTNITKFPTFIDLINYEKRNLYDFFLEKITFTDGFEYDKDDFLYLIKTIYLISYDGHGKGEILLNLFLDNTRLERGYDLLVDSKKVEIKTSKGKIGGGMIKGAKQICHPVQIMNTIKNLLSSEMDIELLNDVTTSGPKGFENLVSILKENGIDENEIIWSVSNGLFSQFFEMKDNLHFNMFVNKIKFNNLAQQLYRLHGVLAIISYQLSEKWDYMFVADVLSGKYTILESFHKNAINEIKWKDYVALYNNENLVFRNGPSTNSNDERHYVSTIYCV